MTIQMQIADTGRDRIYRYGWLEARAGMCDGAMYWGVYNAEAYFPAGTRGFGGERRILQACSDAEHDRDIAAAWKYVEVCIRNAFARIVETMDDTTRARLRERVRQEKYR